MPDLAFVSKCREHPALYQRLVCSRCRSAFICCKVRDIHPFFSPNSLHLLFFIIYSTTSWPTKGNLSINTNFLNKCPHASALSWVENTFNITSTYTVISSAESDASAYLVPFPPNYTATMQGQWLTDVIVLNPSCSWQPTKETRRISITSDFEMNVTLPQVNLDVVLDSGDLSVYFLFCSALSIHN